jgi:hypothetical protein
LFCSFQALLNHSLHLQLLQRAPFLFPNAFLDTLFKSVLDTDTNQ